MFHIARVHILSLLANGIPPPLPINAKTVESIPSFLSQFVGKLRHSVGTSARVTKTVRTLQGKVDFVVRA